MSKKRHKKSRHRTPSPDREGEKGSEKQRRVASEKKEGHTHEHHGSVSLSDRKRKTDHKDRTLSSPKTPSSGNGRELKKPVYRLSTSAEKKDCRKRDEEITPKAGQHRRHGETRGEKTRSETSHAATAVPAKDIKRTSSSSETRRSQSHSTSSPQRSKANLCKSKDHQTVSGTRSSHRTSTSSSSSPTKHASVDLQEQRRKLVKRRSEGENAEPPAKTSRSAPAPRRASEELREERKKLVERRRSSEEVKVKTSSAKQEKGVQQDKTQSSRSSSTSKCSSSTSASLSRSAKLDSGYTAQLSPKNSVPSPTNHASPKPQSSISFRIPKKPNALPSREDIWDQDDESTDQSAASPPKLPSKSKAAQATSSFIPRSLTNAGKATAAPKSLSTAKVSFKLLSSAKPSQTTTSFKPLTTTQAVQASVTVKATVSSKSPCSTVASQAPASPERPSTPRAGPSTAFLSPFSTSKTQDAASLGTFSTTGLNQVAASPELFSTPRTAHQSTSNLASPICWSQQQENDNKVPQGFHSGAASFSAPVHPPEPTQVMPGSVLDNQPSFWSSETEPAHSFIFPEDNHDVGDNDQEMHILEELQQARCEHLLEVNLIESYGELTAMDIDPPDEGATPTSVLSKELMQQNLLIVLDTNILLSHLDLVKKIRSHGLGSLGFPTVLIPWVVLQELDAMKNGKLTSAVERRATPAVNYIYSCLKSQEPRLWGQSMQQASMALCGLKTENNDDRVLQCCLQYQKLYPKSGLILCTNDKNLCSKAVLSGVRAFSKADLLQEVDRLKAGVLLSTAPTADQRTACPSWQPTNKGEGRSREEPSPKAEGTERAKAEERRRAAAAAAATSREVSESVCVLEDTLTTAFSAILQKEMTDVYGDLWNEIVYLKPPWSLCQALQCVKKHWIAVFGNIVQRGLQSNINQLIDCLCTDKTVDHKCVLKALSLAIELLTAFSSRSNYSGLLPQSINTLQGLLHRLRTQPSRSPKTNEDSAMLEEEPSQEGSVTHQEVWQVFENTWTNVWNHSTAVFTAFRYVPGSMETAPPPSQDALYCLQKLCVAVPQLQQLFQRLLSADCSVNDAQSLLNFIQTTEIAAIEPRFTAQALYDCLSQQEYRQKLCVGSTQLSDLQVNLERCAAAVERMLS